MRAAIAAIETDVELWSNRLRITELWVADEYQRGIGHALLEDCQGRQGWSASCIILETQSCNVNAINSISMRALP